MGQLSPIEGNKFAEVQTQPKPEQAEAREGGGTTGQRRSMLATAPEEAENE